jgi:predicted Zn-dependent protease
VTSLLKKSLPLLLLSGIIFLLPGSPLRPEAGCSKKSAADTDILERGKAVFFEGRYGEALEIWAALEGGAPCYFSYDKWKARALLMTGTPGKAVDLLTPYLEVIPEHPELLLLLGTARLDMGDFEHSMMLLGAGERSLSDSAGIYLTIAEVYHRFGLFGRAEDARTKARLLLNLDSSAALSQEPSKK